MIGTMEAAAVARTAYINHDHEYVLSGNGTTRMVYIIDGVVYKVAIDNDADNVAEYKNICNLKGTLPPGFDVPEVSLYKVHGEKIIAMQYIDGVAMSECWCILPKEIHLPSCIPSEVLSVVSKFIDDTGGYNVIKEYSTGTYFIIDAVI